MQMAKFCCCKEVLRNITNLTISLVLTTLGNKPKKFDLVHQTVSHREVGMG